MLYDLVELLDRLVDLLGTGILLPAGGADLLHQFRRLLDIRHHLGEQLARLDSDLHAVAGELGDLRSRLLTTLGELSHLAGDDREPLAVLAGAGRLDGRVQGEQVGLAGDLFDDVDLGCYLFHGLHCRLNRLAPLEGVLRRLDRHFLGLYGVVGVLADVGTHLLHAGRRLFRRRCLLARTLRHLLGARGEFLTPSSDVVGRGFDLRYDFPELAHHVAHGSQKQPGLVLGGEAYLDGEVAGRKFVGGLHPQLQGALDASGHQQGKRHCDQHGRQGNGHQQEHDLPGRLLDHTLRLLHFLVGRLGERDRCLLHIARCTLVLLHGGVAICGVLDAAVPDRGSHLGEAGLVLAEVFFDHLDLFSIVLVDDSFFQVRHTLGRLVSLCSPLHEVLIHLLRIPEIQEHILLVAPHAEDVGPGPGGVLGQLSFGVEEGHYGLFPALHPPVAGAGHHYKQE